MQAASVAALTIVLALGTSIATASFCLQQAQPEPADPGTEPAAAIAGLKDQIAALRKECAELRQQLESRPLGESKRELAGPGEAQIEAAVRSWLEQHGTALLAEASAQKPAVQIDKGQAFRTLADLGVPYEERLKVWRDVRKAGKLDDLITMLREHAEKSPNDANAHAALGHALVQKINSPNVGGLERAVLGRQIDDAFGKALEIDPEHWEARYSRAIGQTFWPAFMGKQAEAIQNFETLIQQQERRSPKPEYACTYVLLGNVYAQQGKMEKAREVWQRGLNQFPSDEDLKGKVK